MLVIDKISMYHQKCLTDHCLVVSGTGYSTPKGTVCVAPFGSSPGTAGVSCAGAYTVDIV